MKKLIQQRIQEYADYFGKNIPYFQKDGSILNELNFDFEKLSDEFLNLYEEAIANGDVDNELLQESSIPKDQFASVLEKVKLQDEDLKELFLKLENCTVFEGSIIIVNQKISDETAVAIGKILSANKVNIEYLDLSDNALLNKESGIALGEALKRNKTLKYLSLRKNELKTDGNNRIIEALDSNNSISELEFGLVSDESLSYLAEFLGKNSSLKNIGLEEDPNSPWTESTVNKFIATLRSKKNQLILSCNIKPLNIIKQRMFLGEVALICEKNRKKELNEMENLVNEEDYHDVEYYCTERDLLFSKVFSIKAYINNVFGSVLEEGLYKIEKDRLDLIRRKNVAEIEGKPFEESGDILTTEGSILELAKYLYYNLEKPSKKATA